jgi:hypothetical protein
MLLSQNALLMSAKYAEVVGSHPGVYVYQLLTVSRLIRCTISAAANAQVQMQVVKKSLRMNISLIAAYNRCA